MNTSKLYKYDRTRGKRGAKLKSRDRRLCSKVVLFSCAEGSCMKKIIFLECERRTWMWTLKTKSNNDQNDISPTATCRVSTPIQHKALGRARTHVAASSYYAFASLLLRKWLPNGLEERVTSNLPQGFTYFPHPPFSCKIVLSHRVHLWTRPVHL